MGKTAFLYPGQGAQKIGMGKDFYEAYPEVKRLMDEASESTGIDLRKLCFEENELLNRTAYTQPAMVAVSLGMTAVVRSMGLDCDVTAGLSLGEYAAISTAGAFTPLQATELVAKRGQYMEEAYPAGKGAMAAVLGLDAEIVEHVVSGIDRAYVANYNCPGQLVITGDRDAVDSASQALKEAGAKRVLPVNVSGPFHSPLLSEAGVKLGKALLSSSISGLNIPYVSNVTADYVEDSVNIRDLLVRQVSSPVRFEQSIRKMLENGVDTFVEIGPGKTLSGFIKRISTEVRTVNVDSVEKLAEVEACLAER